MLLCIIIFSSVILILLIVLIFLLLKRPVGDSGNMSSQLLDLKNQLTLLQTNQLENQTKSLLEQQKLLNQTQSILSEQLKNVTDNVSQGQGNITSSLRMTVGVIQEIQKKLGSLETTTQHIQEIGKDISSLQEILQAPKLRGNLGEYLLEELLKDILPASNYEMQYSFKDNTKVDAIIKLGKGLVPVDSKFPLESFQRLISAEDELEKKKFKKEFIVSVKNRIDEISNKYIKPDENTFEFGLMYIPAENVFYEIIISDSLSEKQYELLKYAIDRHVIPVSPNTFYAYLMAIAYGLKGFKIEQETKQLINQLAGIQNQFNSFYQDFSTLGKHISNAGSKYDELMKKAERITDKVNEITASNKTLEESSTKIIG